MTDAAPDVESEMRRLATPVEDRLARVRDAVSRYRDLDHEARDLEQRLEEVKRARSEIERSELPNLFLETGVDKIAVPAEGNLPAAEAVLTDYFKASIPASWPPAMRERAFGALETLGLSGLIKNEVTVAFGRDENEQARALVDQLRRQGFEPETERSVHHATLTAAIRELCQDGRRPAPDVLDAVGATVGKAVRVKFS